MKELVETFLKKEQSRYEFMNILNLNCRGILDGKSFKTFLTLFRIEVMEEDSSKTMVSSLNLLYDDVNRFFEEKSIEVSSLARQIVSRASPLIVQPIGRFLPSFQIASAA